MRNFEISRRSRRVGHSVGQTSPMAPPFAQASATAHSAQLEVGAAARSCARPSSVSPQAARSGRVAPGTRRGGRRRPGEGGVPRGDGCSARVYSRCRRAMGGQRARRGNGSLSTRVRRPRERHVHITKCAMTASNKSFSALRDRALWRCRIRTMGAFWRGLRLITRRSRRRGRGVRGAESTGEALESGTRCGADERAERVR